MQRLWIWKKRENVQAVVEMEACKQGKEKILEGKT